MELTPPTSLSRSPARARSFSVFGCAISMRSHLQRVREQRERGRSHARAQPDVERDRAHGDRRTHDVGVNCKADAFASISDAEHMDSWDFQPRIPPEKA